MNQQYWVDANLKNEMGILVECLSVSKDITVEHGGGGRGRDPVSYCGSVGKAQSRGAC